jgi:hypothetical protein
MVTVFCHLHDPFLLQMLPPSCFYHYIPCLHVPIRPFILQSNSSKTSGSTGQQSPGSHLPSLFVIVSSKLVWWDQVALITALISSSVTLWPALTSSWLILVIAIMFYLQPMGFCQWPSCHSVTMSSYILSLTKLGSYSIDIPFLTPVSCEITTTWILIILSCHQIQWYCSRADMAIKQGFHYSNKNYWNHLLLDVTQVESHCIKIRAVFCNFTTTSNP